MATGIVKTITSPTQGTVEVDETGEILNFEDENFSTTGLREGSACTFDLRTVQGRDGSIITLASNLQAVTVVESPITGAYTGDITANVGQTYLIKSASGVVTGNININGGKVIVADSAQITGDVTVNNDGTFVARKNGVIKGSILVNSGGNLKVVNGGLVKGNINVTAGGRLIVGNDNGGGTINGSVSIQKIRKIEITNNSKIN